MKPDPHSSSVLSQPAYFDVLVIGSGVAGLFAALSLSVGGAADMNMGGARMVDATAGAGGSGGMRVGIITKGEISQSATRWAQGGIAAVLPGDEDSIDQHLSDTLKAGDGLCDLDAVRILVDEGPDAIIALVAAGMSFDRDNAGNYLRAREGGHSAARVLHAGGVATGAEVERALVEAVCASDVCIMERWFSFDLIIESGICKGVRCIDPDGNLTEVRADVVLLATGGAGQLYSVTTNPPEATGDGVAMALRAGVPVADLEFFQFHPTALYHAVTPRPLLSEALRGHGAILRDKDGNRFVDELSPRDKVSRAIALKMAEQGMSHLWLDATGLGGFDERFPTISAMLTSCNLDPAVDWLPVSPAAHYVSGGILTDLDGATGCEGLFAAGEVACTGVHGANRLASNSLLEGLVYGIRAAGAIVSGKRRADPTGAIGAWLGADSRIACTGVDEFEDLRGIPSMGTSSLGQESFAISGLTDFIVGNNPAISNNLVKMRERFQEEMMLNAGVIRSADGLSRMERIIRDTVKLLRGQGYAADERSAGGQAPTKDQVHTEGQGHTGQREFAGGQAPATGNESLSDTGTHNHVHIDRSAIELANMCIVADALVRSAYDRRETRGAHARMEYPDASDTCLVRIVHGKLSV